MTTKTELPEVVDKSESELAAIKAAVESTQLPAETKAFVIKCIDLAVWLPLKLQSKTISISRLRRLIFGKGYRNQCSNRGKRKRSSDNVTSGSPAVSDSSGLTESTSTTESSNMTDEPVLTEDETGSSAVGNDAINTGKGHGRMSHTVYKDCDEETIASDYALGALCPMACGGKLGRYSSGILIRIFGQNLAKVKRYSIEKLRCCLCGYIVLPEATKALGKEKYDATFKSMLALQKYFVAVPFYRQAYFQQQLGFPLPDSTQWDLIESLASACYAPFDVLKTQAANSKVMHLDDTRVRILSEIQRFKSAAPGDRTGMFTTGFICEYDDHKIALFMNGTQHVSTTSLNEPL